MLSMGQALAAGLRAGLRAAGVPVWLGTPMTDLHVERRPGRPGSGSSAAGGAVLLRARRGVLLASRRVRAQRARCASSTSAHRSVPQWTVGAAGNTGDGIEAGQRLGAALDLMDDAWWGPSIPLTGGPYFCLAERSLPGCLLVNGAGQRFVNEAAPVRRRRPRHVRQPQRRGPNPGLADLRPALPRPLPVRRAPRIDRTLFRTYDVLPTIARRIGLRLPRGLSGRPAGSRAIRRRGRISVLSRASVGRVTLSRRGLRRAKRAALRRKIGLFGQGPRSLFDFGPNRGLLLKTVNRFNVAGAAGGLRAQLSDPSDCEDVRKQSLVHPDSRHRAGARRPPRLAPRRRGRDQRLHPGRHEDCAHQGPQGRVLLVPGGRELLEPGRNPVEIFTVSRSRKRKILLRRIYGRPFPGRS